MSYILLQMLLTFLSNIRLGYKFVTGKKPQLICVNDEGKKMKNFDSVDPEFNLLKGVLNFLYITSDTNRR
jgi:hypothetical protein